MKPSHDLPFPSNWQAAAALTGIQSSAGQGCRIKHYRRFMLTGLPDYDKMGISSDSRRRPLMFRRESLKQLQPELAIQEEDALPVPSEELSTAKRFRRNRDGCSPKSVITNGSPDYFTDFATLRAG